MYEGGCGRKIQDGYSHSSDDQKIIRLLLDNDTRIILDPIMRSVSELSLDEIFGTLMNN